MSETGEPTRRHTNDEATPSPKSPKKEPRVPDLNTVMEAAFRNGVTRRQASVWAEPDGTIHYGAGHIAIWHQLSPRNTKIHWMDWIESGWQRITIEKRNDRFGQHAQLIINIDVAGKDKKELEKRLGAGLDIVHKITGPALEDSRVIWEAKQGNYEHPDKKFSDENSGTHFLKHGIRISQDSI